MAFNLHFRAGTHRGDNTTQHSRYWKKKKYKDQSVRGIVQYNTGAFLLTSSFFGMVFYKQIRQYLLLLLLLLLLCPSHFSHIYFGPFQVWYFTNKSYYPSFLAMLSTFISGLALAEVATQQILEEVYAAMWWAAVVVSLPQWGRAYLLCQEGAKMKGSCVESWLLLVIVLESLQTGYISDVGYEIWGYCVSPRSTRASSHSQFSFIYAFA